ncbi:MAG: TIGR00295 family protein [Candidatus Bathyarchaeota archaeon]|nr:TIGR00295 family protein [Candidatus Bathyarchaeota archaeon]
MSEKLPTREEALELLRKSGCQKNVVKHCKAVAELAEEIACACRQKGLTVNLELVEIGALLHDIGRSKTHSVHHAVTGAKIARSLGLPESIVSIVKRHVGGGITSEEARKLGWPKDVYVPQTLEERIVCYADKLIEGSKRVPIERTLENFEEMLPSSAAERIRKLHAEMIALVGDCNCIP